MQPQQPTHAQHHTLSLDDIYSLDSLDLNNINTHTHTSDIKIGILKPTSTTPIISDYNKQCNKKEEENKNNINNDILAPQITLTNNDIKIVHSRYNTNDFKIDILTTPTQDIAPPIIDINNYYNKYKSIIYAIWYIEKGGIIFVFMVKLIGALVTIGLLHLWQLLIAFYMDPDVSDESRILLNLCLKNELNINNYVINNSDLNINDVNNNNDQQPQIKTLNNTETLAGNIETLAGNIETLAGNIHGYNDCIHDKELKSININDNNNKDMNNSHNEFMLENININDNNNDDKRLKMKLESRKEQPYVNIIEIMPKLWSKYCFTEDVIFQTYKIYKNNKSISTLQS
eukprot:234669_1